MKIKLFYFILFSISTLLSTAFVKNTVTDTIEDKFIVVLDAGHGGHDPGNLGNGYLEKSIALNIVLKIGEYLEQQPNIEVIYTRKDDTFIDLYVRGEIANKANADLFVSVHCDSHTSEAHGAGTFVLGLHANKQNFEIAKKENSVIYLEDNYQSKYSEYDINSPESVIGLTIMQEEFLDQSILLAKTMQDNFSNKLKRNDRKVKQAGFIVLHQTFMPSVLVETGFLTYKPEGEYLNSKDGQREMGRAIADAITDYRKSIANGLEATTVTNNTIADPTTEEIRIKKEREAAAIAAKEERIKQEADSKAAELALKVKEEETRAATLAKEEDTKKAALALEAKKNAFKKEQAKRDVLVQQERDRKAVVKKEANRKATAIALEMEKKALKVEQAKEAVLAKQEEANKIKADREALDEKEQKIANTKATTTKKIENESKSITYEGIIFKVQLFAVSKEIELLSSNFKGLSTLSKEPFKNFYRYMYGNTNSLSQAKLLKSNANTKGYTSAYIVAYKGEERITISEANRYLSE